VLSEEREDDMARTEKTGVLADISRGLVELHSEYYGKGPTKAKTYMVDDTVVCLLHGGFTIVERTLIEDGNAEAVHEIRHSFQTSMGDRFKRVVEEATGRRVIAYMSQIHNDPDIVVELFVLETRGEPLIGQHEEDVAESG
jgi:uncharacterized protein YbcI